MPHKASGRHFQNDSTSWRIIALTSFTSRPRAATSVAHIIVTRPSRKSRRVSSRSCWDLSPWIAWIGNPSLRKLLVSWSQPFFVSTKTYAILKINNLLVVIGRIVIVWSARCLWREDRLTRTLPPSLCFRMCARSFGYLSWSVTTSTTWVMFTLARNSREPTCTWYGSCRKSAASFWTSFGPLTRKL